MAHTVLDDKSLALLQIYLHDFLKYLAKNPATLFRAREYEVALLEHLRKAVGGEALARTLFGSLQTHLLLLLLHK